MTRFNRPEHKVSDIEDLLALDAAAEEWADIVEWRGQLNLLAHMSTVFAGKRVTGPGGAELKLLILRQKAMIDRWVRQAYVEGYFAGSGHKLTPEIHAALSGSDQ